MLTKTVSDQKKSYCFLVCDVLKIKKFLAQNYETAQIKKLSLWLMLIARKAQSWANRSVKKLLSLYTLAAQKLTSMFPHECPHNFRILVGIEESTLPRATWKRITSVRIVSSFSSSPPPQKKKKKKKKCSMGALNQTFYKQERKSFHHTYFITVHKMMWLKQKNKKSNVCTLRTAGHSLLTWNI